MGCSHIMSPDLPGTWNPFFFKPPSLSPSPEESPVSPHNQLESVQQQQQQQHPKNRWNLWRFRASESTVVLLGRPNMADSFLSTSGCIWRTYNLSKNHQIRSTHQKHPSKSNHPRNKLILQPRNDFSKRPRSNFLVEEKTEKHLVKVISGFLGCMQWGKDGKGYTCQNIKKLFHSYSACVITWSSSPSIFVDLFQVYVDKLVF